MLNLVNKKIKGYFTVEASMIIPLVIFLIAFLFYLSFFLYNRCVLSQDAYILAFRGSVRCKEENVEVEKYIEKNSKKQFGVKYMGLDGPYKSMGVNSKKIRVIAEGKMKVSFIKNFDLSNTWSLKVVREAERICPVDYIRKIRLLEKAGDAILKD